MNSSTEKERLANLETYNLNNDGLPKNNCITRGGMGERYNLMRTKHLRKGCCGS